MFSLMGTFHVEIIRDGVAIYRQSHRNGIVNIGKNNILDVMFRSQAQSTWYCGLIDPLTNLSALDTMASHTGWTESTDYSEVVRQTWSPSAASSQNIINGTAMSFSINSVSSIQIDGMFICNDNTKGGSSGTLWCTSEFNNKPTVISGDTVQVQYSLTVN